ncbi:MAG: hypothetical protein ACRDSP_19940 [Pseudonocardiaceae bacterium]
MSLPEQTCPYGDATMFRRAKLMQTPRAAGLQHSQQRALGAVIGALADGRQDTSHHGAALGRTTGAVD